MQPAYKNNEADAFFASQEKFNKLRTTLEATETMKLEHGVVEELLSREGLELLRQLLQDHLDLRAHTERNLLEEGPVVGSDGMERMHRRSGRSRGLESLFGTVVVTRSGYEGRGVSRLHPLDAELNLPDDKYSHGVRKRVALEAAKNSFDEVTKTIEMSTGAHVAKRQAEELARNAARDFEAFYANREEMAGDDIAKSGEVMVLSVDGKGVPMRRSSLRKQTREAADKRESKLKHRRSKGEKRHTRRMATVAAVYTTKRHERTVQDIVCDLREPEASPPTTKRPRPEHKRVWASLERSPSEVIEDMFAEASRRDPEHQKSWVALVDGNEHQLQEIHKQAEMEGVSVTIVLDVIHVLEYLWKAAWVLHDEGSQEADEWVRERLRRILEGHSSDVAAGIRRSATRRGLSQTKREPIDRCARYLLNHRDYLRYDQYLAAGFPIATGVIEGACRYLVKDRMDITGARWSLEGAEAVLRLRAIRSSGDFDEYWRFHVQQERLLNHVMSYADEPPSTRVELSQYATERPSLRLV